MVRRVLLAQEHWPSRGSRHREKRRTTQSQRATASVSRQATKTNAPGLSGRLPDSRPDQQKEDQDAGNDPPDEARSSHAASILLPPPTADLIVDPRAPRASRWPRKEPPHDGHGHHNTQGDCNARPGSHRSTPTPLARGHSGTLAQLSGLSLGRAVVATVVPAPEAHETDRYGSHRHRDPIHAEQTNCDYRNRDCGQREQQGCPECGRWSPHPHSLPARLRGHSGTLAQASDMTSGALKATASRS
jgi:hypothetical protein